MSDTELKPCPLCGGKAELWHAYLGFPRRPAWIGCMDRCCVLVSREHATDEEAIASWNRRSTPPAEPVGDAMTYAEGLATALHEKHYSHVTHWQPLRGDLIGLLTQIDNMTAALSAPRADPVPGEDVRAAFEKWTKPKGLDLTMSEDAWGRPIYQHSHIEAMWGGFKAGAALSASPSPVGESRDGLIERLEAERLRKMVERRDEFITGKGLWDEFKEACRD